jgi:hypothetical protein
VDAAGAANASTVSCVLPCHDEARNLAELLPPNAVLAIVTHNLPMAVKSDRPR